MQLRPFPNDSFTLAHFSDPHLSSLVGVKIRDLLNKRILGYFSWLKKRRRVHRPEVLAALLKDLKLAEPDHIVVTGDLTHLGLPSEFRQVGQWLSTLGPPERVTLIPGNHDSYVARAWDKSCSIWAPYLRSDASQDPATASEFFPILRVRGPIALIGLTSARPSIPFLAVGSLGRSQLVKFEKILAQTGELGLLRVVLIHHSPVQGTINWRKRLTDSAAFAEVLARQGAELVLHGHAHYPIQSELETPAGKVPVIGTPSASALDRRPERLARYHLYRFERLAKGWSITLSVRSFSFKQHCFIADEEICLPLATG